MLGKSIEAIDEVLAYVNKEVQHDDTVLEKDIKTAEEWRKQNKKIIDDAKTTPVERLRALTTNLINAESILQLSRERSSLLLMGMFAASVRMFQEETAYELNLIKATIILKTPKSEESMKYTQIEKDLQRMKRTMNEKWKPLMDSLRDEIEARRKFLDEHR